MVLSMGVLILVSSFFSGSEAAFFSMSPRDQKVLSSQGIAGRTATKLLDNPERLLSAILFWNLLINMIYFAMAAIIGSRMEQAPEVGRTSAILFTMMSLLTIIFFSEMLPKSFAVLLPRQLSIALAIPLSISLQLVSPILPIVAKANQLVTRLIWPSFEAEPEINLADIERAIELGTDDAALLQREKAALAELVQIAETPASEMMQPRNKLWITSSPILRSEVLSKRIRKGLLLVTDESTESVTGAIRIRALRPSQLDDLERATEPVIFVPWSAMVSQVLDLLNAEHRSVAIVVNEYGEMLGALTIDEILQRILAPRHEDESLGEATIQTIGVGHYRVWGRVGFRQLCKHLSIEVDAEGVTTVAGYIGRCNERLARVNDTAMLGEYQLTVTERAASDIWIDVAQCNETEAPGQP